MSRCEEYQELISRLLDGDLTVRERVALEEHIRSCPDCAALYSAFSAISKQVAGDLEEAPLDLRANVMAEIRREEIRKKNRMPAALRGVLAAAACLAIIVGISLGVSPQLRGRISAAAYPKAAKETSDMAFSAELAEEPARYAPEPEPWPAAGEAAVQEAAAEAEITADEAPAELPRAEEPKEDYADAMTASEEENGAGDLDFSGWMDLAVLRELLGGEPAELNAEDLGEPAWTLRVKGEAGEDLVRVYVLNGVLYYLDPAEDTAYQAQLSAEEFEAFLHP